MRHSSRNGPSPRRALARTRRTRLDGDDVVAVDGLAIDLVGRHDVRDALDVRVRRARSELGEAVVLADEDHGQPQSVARFTGLHEDAALDGPVAEEDDGRLIAAGEPARERAPSERDVAADNTRRAEEPVLDVHEMHRAAQATAEPSSGPSTRPSPNNGSSLAWRPGTVIAVHRVRAQLAAHANCHTLLADAG